MDPGWPGPVAAERRPAITSRDILVFLFQWRGTLVSVFLTVVGIATVGAYVLPPVYQASSTVVVEPTKGPSMRAEVYPTTLEAAEVINTEIAIVLSRTVMQSAVDRLKVHQRPPRAGWLVGLVSTVKARLDALGLLDAVDARERWIEALRRDVKVRPVAHSNVFVIRYSNDDPRLAADIVNAVTEEYLTHHFAIYSEQRVAEFYRAQMAEAKAKLDDDRKVLERHRLAHGLAAAPAQKIQFVEQIRSVRERVSRLNLELTETTARLGQDDQRVAILRSKIRASEDEATLLQKRLQALDGAETQAGEMELIVRALEKSYLAYREQFDRASVSAAGNKDVVNVRVVDYASVPARPIYSRLFLIVMAIGAGGVFALVVAMLREYFDQRVVTPAVAEEILGIPVLGSIGPREGAGR